MKKKENEEKNIEKYRRYEKYRNSTTSDNTRLPKVKHKLINLKKFVKLAKKIQGWEKREPIGDYHLEIGEHYLEVILHHKDGRTWSDPARAMSQLMQEILNKKGRDWLELIERIEMMMTLPDGKENLEWYLGELKKDIK